MASLLGNCPKCGADITDEHQYSWCSKCGEALPPDLAARVPHVQTIRAQPQPSTVPAQPTPEFPKSTLAGWFTALAVIGFLAAGLGIILINSSNSTDNQQGAFLLPFGISGGFISLALAKIIRCLHDASYRLQRIEKLLERR